MVANRVFEVMKTPDQWRIDGLNRIIDELQEDNEQLKLEVAELKADKRFWTRADRAVFALLGFGLGVSVMGAVCVGW